ncbi:MAG: very short patch repair endonuclease [Burkholderiaceae bacterium]|nr:very short patch repair endonuclease [Burkholderiaceae bacterium]
MEEAKLLHSYGVQMSDVVDSATRSRMMSGIRSQNTKPEIIIRKALHARGFRYSLHPKGIPGKPDIVMPKWRVAIFVHGCFWHLHGCALSKMPSNNAEFWLTKLSGNQRRDAIVKQQLADSGWRSVTIWECATRGKAAMANLPALIDELAHWIRNQAKSSYLELGAPGSTPLITPPTDNTNDIQADRPVRRTGGTRGRLRLLR